MTDTEPTAPRDGQEREYEVSAGTRIVRARSAGEAASIAAAEAEEESEGKHYQPDPNPQLFARPLTDRTPWLNFYV